MTWVTRQAAAFGALGVLMLASPLWAATDAFGPLSPQDRARVDRGEIVVQVEQTDSAVKHFRAIGLVKASAARVYEVFTDYPNYADIFKLKSSRVLSHSGNTYLVRAAMDLPWPIGEKWVTNHTDLEPKDLSFTYHRVEGNIEAYEGTVAVYSRGPQLCEVYYAAKADPGIPFMPKWLLNRFQAVILPDSIRRVREYLKVQ